MTAAETLAEWKDLKERNTAVKPEFEIQWNYAKCPKCGSSIYLFFSNFCPNCGQRLDWSDFSTEREADILRDSGKFEEVE